MRHSKILIVIMVITVALVGCSQSVETTSDTDVSTTVNDESQTIETTDLKVIGLKGPTSMGMIQLINGSSDLDENINASYTIESAPDLIIGKLINNEVDIAAVPTNLASIIYKKTEGDYQLAALNTKNVLFVVSNTDDKITSLEDLKGKTVHVSGKGATPEYIIKYLLEQNGLTEDITLDFALDHSSLAQAVTAGQVDIAILPQPFVTSVTMANQDISIDIDLLDEWNKLDADNMLALGCLIVNKDYATKNKLVVNNFLEEYEKSIQWVNDNPQEASQLIEKHGILPKAKLAELAIPHSNIVYKDATAIKNDLTGFYQVLFDFNPKSIGGEIPDDEFYYEK